MVGNKRWLFSASMKCKWEIMWERVKYVLGVRPEGGIQHPQHIPSMLPACTISSRSSCLCWILEILPFSSEDPLSLPASPWELIITKPNYFWCCLQKLKISPLLPKAP